MHLKHSAIKRKSNFAGRNTFVCKVTETDLSFLLEWRKIDLTEWATSSWWLVWQDRSLHIPTETRYTTTEHQDFIQANNTLVLAPISQSRSNSAAWWLLACVPDFLSLRAIVQAWPIFSATKSRSVNPCARNRLYECLRRNRIHPRSRAAHSWIRLTRHLYVWEAECDVTWHNSWWQ